jgi:hypothetical protein
MIPPKTKQKYFERLRELISKGENIEIRTKTIPGEENWATGRISRSRQVVQIDWPSFVEWRTNCITLLDNIIPSNSIHRATVDGFNSLKNDKGQLQFGVSFLKSIQDDFKNGYLDSLSLEIEAELSGDYMGQAESLLNEGTTGRNDHVPAAVLAGAVLEKSLKTICAQISPPEPTVNEKGNPLMMDALISCLKKRGVFNEIVAKQLRTWAGIRNSAAHGEFENFNRVQVESMLVGIESFLAQYLS